MIPAASVLFVSPVAYQVMQPLEELEGAPLHDPGTQGEDHLRRLARQARVAVMIGYETMDARRMDLFPELGLIAALGAGHDGIDLAAAEARGIAVTNTPGTNTDDVADHAVALWLNGRRGISAGDRLVRSGGWLTDRPPLSRSIAGEKVGIAGLGRIGAAIARRAEIFGATIGWWGRSVRPDVPWPRHDSLAALARWADTLFVALPGGDDTARLVDAGILDALGPGGMLVNIGRGSVVDASALESALRDRRLGAAALDVFETEPFDGRGLADLDTLLMTPHAAAGTDGAVRRLRGMVFESIRAFAEGEPVPYRLV